MKLLVILSVAALAAAAPQSAQQLKILHYENAGPGGNIRLVILSLPASVAAPQSAQQAQILRHENVGEGDNHDKYTFETSDGISDQSDDKDLAVSKFFTWVDSEGVERKVKFADDQGGYQYEEEEEEGPGAPPPLLVASMLGTG